MAIPVKSDVAAIEAPDKDTKQLLKESLLSHCP